MGRVIETLLPVHAHEIFFGGAFNSDPHPSNILLLPDGRLGPFDYGQFKHMSLKDRIIYAKLIIALHREDRSEVVRLAVDEMGHKTKNMNHNMIYRVLAFSHDRDTKGITLGKDFNQFTEYAEEIDPVEHVNDEYIMAARVSILVRAMANALGLRVRVADYWCLEAEKFLKSQGYSVLEKYDVAIYEPETFVSA